MANIAITSRCNLHCSYCFTQEIYRNESDGFGHMTLPVFKKALDFVVRSDIKQIRILGGEPTLHPQFSTFLDLALRTGRPVRIFSNGTMSEQVLDLLSQIPDDRITLVININNPDEFVSSPIRKTVLAKLHSKIIPGLNIYRKGIELNPMLALIETYDLKKQVRLGLAHPCAGYNNQYLPVRHYFDVGRNIVDFARTAAGRSVRINLDCGFVPCMFGNTDLQSLGLDRELGLHCEPIPDILPDGSLVPCYPLSGMQRHGLDKFDTAGSLRDQFKQTLSLYEALGIFKTCSICDYKHNGLCTGGCVAHKLRRITKNT
ncbi:radical SAM protein [bacterium]|nr:radical SAM protein [bacterium]